MARANWSQAIHNQALETCHYYIHVFLRQVSIRALPLPPTLNQLQAGKGSFYKVGRRMSQSCYTVHSNCGPKNCIFEPSLTSDDCKTIPACYALESDEVSVVEVVSLDSTWPFLSGKHFKHFVTCWGPPRCDS